MRKLLPLALLAVSIAAAAEVKSDWERENEDRLRQSEERWVPPPALDRAHLVELRGVEGADFRYYVDPASVSVGEDRIVRFVLVARSAGGIENIAYEGMRCPGEYRVYAVGHPDGKWGGRPSAWRAIPGDARLGEHVLSRRYFCPARLSVQNTREAVDAVRAGGHPAVLKQY